MVDKNVGKMRQMKDETTIEWKIHNFIPMMSKKPGTNYDSPVFAFSDKFYNLSIYPNGNTKAECDEGHIALFLRCKGKHGHVIYFTASFKDSNGGLKHSKEMTHRFDDNSSYGWINFYTTSELMKEKDELLPDGVLTIHIRLQNKAERLVGITQCQRLLKLSSDLKNILENADTDVVFKFKEEKQIQAHRRILEYRSNYFETMFENDTAENQTGIFTIDDIDPDVFELVLSYIYSGEVEELSTDNMCQLYLAAHKYHLIELKELCTAFMEEHMTENEFCDVFAIADTYDEPGLMRYCKEFFVLKSKLIIKTEQWKSFHEKKKEDAFELLNSLFEQFNLKKF